MSLSVENWRANQRTAYRAVYCTITNHTSSTLYRVNYGLTSGGWSCFPPERINPSEIVDFGSHSSAMVGGTSGFVFYATKPSIDGEQQKQRFEFQWENPWLGGRRVWSRPPDGLMITESAHLNACCEVTWVCEGISQNAPILTSSSTMPVGTTTRRVSQEQDRLLSLPANAPVVQVDPAANPSISTVADRSKAWVTDISRAIRSVHLVIDNKTECTLLRRDQELSAGWWALLPPEKIEPYSQVEFGAFSSVIWTACSGSVFYKIQLPGAHASGGENTPVFMRGDIVLKWSVPVVGGRTQDAFAPAPLKCELNAVGGARAKITTYLTQPQQQVTVDNLTSSLLPAHTDRRKTVKLMTFNTMLLPPMVTKHDPMKRVAPIASRIIAAGYDCVCLQEVLHGPARQALEQQLKADYPYMVAKSGSNLHINLNAAELDQVLRVGKDSGLLFASKFPIVRQEFRLFAVGAGTDTLVQKGCLGVKLDLSSIVPNKSLFVFTTHLQANPDGSIPWKLLGSSGHQKAREARNKQCKIVYNFISEWIRAEEANRRSTEDLSIVLCGDMNISAELGTEIQSELTQSLVSSTLPALASKINHKSVRIGTVEQLLSVLAESKVPLGLLGVLRKLLIVPRDRLLALITMIVVVIQQLATEELRRLHSNDKQNALLWRRTKRHTGFRQPDSVNQPTDNENAQDPEVSVQHEPIQTVFLDHVAYLYRCVLSRTSASSTDPTQSNTDVIADVSRFWSEISFHVKASFEGGLFEKELRPGFDLLKEIQPLRFQLVKGMETVLGVGLTAEYFIKLIQSRPTEPGQSRSELDSDAVGSNISSEHLSDFDWKAPNLPLNCFLRPTPLESSINSPVDPSEEYMELLSTLNNPRDLFREKNRLMPGYTVDSRGNVLVKSHGGKRVDYIFLFDKFGTGLEGKKLQTLSCVECHVSPFGESPTTMLSDHFAVESTISL